MFENAIVMKKEIRAVANYKAIIISKNYITLLLGLVSLVFIFLNYGMSSLYILLILNALPPILAFGLKDYADKYKSQILFKIMEDKPFQLSILKRKYKYSRVNYIANSVAYLFALILISLWQYNFNTLFNKQNILANTPVLILASGLALRIVAIIYFQIKIPYDLSHNKV